MRNRRTDLALEARELWQESAEERTQLEGVEAVMITAEGEMLSFRDHQRLTAEEAWSALQSGMSEETAQDVS